METQEKKPESLPGCLLRVFWMVLGNMPLFFMAYFIAAAPSGSQLKFSVYDAVYAVTTGALLLARYLDIRLCGGTTVTGVPATMSHFRRYALLLLPVCIAIWAGAHAISYFR